MMASPKNGAIPTTACRPPVTGTVTTIKTNTCRNANALLCRFLFSDDAKLKKLQKLRKAVTTTHSGTIVTSSLVEPSPRPPLCAVSVNFPTSSTAYRTRFDSRVRLCRRNYRWRARTSGNGRGRIAFDRDGRPKTKNGRGPPEEFRFHADRRVHDVRSVAKRGAIVRADVGRRKSRLWRSETPLAMAAR